MEPLDTPKTLNIYQLVKQSGLSFAPVGYNNISIGTGFFLTRTEAEHHRTMEVLKEPAGSTAVFHVFELTIPNPAYKE